MSVHSELLSGQNLMYWAGLAVVIWLQGEGVGRGWSETRRWRLGYVTLFGSGLAMVIWGGWDGPTWAGLALLVLWARLGRVERLLVGELWERREGYRWTVQYVAGFALALPLLRAGWLDLTTAIGLFMALGVCGAVKVGREGWRDSRAARRLRQRWPGGKEAGNVGTGRF